MGLELALIGLNVVLLVAQALAWRGARRIQHNLAGSIGYELARIIAWIIGWTLVGRLLSVAIIALVGIDPDNLQSALALTLATQLGVGVLFVWVAVQVWRLRKDEADLYPAHAEWCDRLECVRVEVDQVGVPSAVAVDDGDRDAALSGTH